MKQEYKAALLFCVAVMAAGCGGGGGGGVATPEQPQMPPPVTSPPSDPMTPPPTTPPPSPDPMPDPSPSPDPTPDPTPSPDPPPEPTIPRSFDKDYSAAMMAATHLNAINYDVNEGEAGNGANGVKVAFLENGVDMDHPTLAGQTLETPQMGSPAEDSHGTLVALLIGGRIDKEVYGPAYKATLEFVCCPEPTVIQIDEGHRYLAEQSSAFVVNNSFSLIRATLTVAVGDFDRDNCLAIIPNPDTTGPEDFCDDYPGRGPLKIEVPNTNAIPQKRLDLVHKACVNPDMATERMCVFSAGNDGFNSQGEVRMSTPFNPTTISLSVPKLLDPDETLSDAVRMYFENNLYERGGYAGLPVQDPRFEGHFLVVAALADDYTLADYSNGCGEVKHVCLSALGNIPFRICDVAMSSSGPCTGPLPTGTSFAAPLVTGAAAVLKSTFPNLSVTVVSTMLLTTAVDLRPGGDRVDDEFGWGKLDLGAAMTAAGLQTTSDGVRLEHTRVKAGSAIDAALASSTASFGMFDMHDRPYLHFVASRMTSPQLGPALSFNGWLHSTSAMMGMDFHDRMGLSGSQRGSALPGMLGVAGAAGWGMGLEQCHLSCPSRRDVQVGSLVESSALAWTERHVQVPGGSIGLVLETGLEEDDGMTYTNRGLFVESGLSEGLLRLEAGMLDEKATFMGGAFSGALAVRPGDSQYISASLGVPVGEHAFSAGYTLGKASSGLVANSYVTEIDDVSYDAYRLAFGGERWELGYIVPLAATKGGMRVESIGGYTGSEGDWSIVETDDGVVVLGETSAQDWSYRKDSHWVDLGAGNRERRLGLVMAKPYGSWEMTFAVEHVANSPREFYAGDETRVAVAFSLNL